MLIGLIDVDGTGAKKKKWGGTQYPNLALAKLARWHKENGDAVIYKVSCANFLHTNDWGATGAMLVYETI